MLMCSQTNVNYVHVKRLNILTNSGVQKTINQSICMHNITYLSPYNLYVPQSTIYQLCRDGSSWVEPVLSKDKCVLLKDTTQWHSWGSNPQPNPWLGRKESKQTKQTSHQ